MNRLFLSLTICLIFVAVAPAQIKLSPHLEEFIYYASANHFDLMSEEEYQNITPAEWAWALGQIFDAEFEYVNTNPDEQDLERKIGYLYLLWEELIDYVSAAGESYESEFYSAANMRYWLYHGFYGYDQDNLLADLYSKLKLDSTTPSRPMVYLSSIPAGGQHEYPEGKLYPWHMSAEIFFAEDPLSGTLLEAPSTVYAEHYHDVDESLSSDVESGESTIGDVSDDIDSADSQKNGSDSQLDSGPLSGTWQATAGEAVIEFTFTGGPDSGRYTMRILKDGNQVNSISGTYAGKPDDTGAYVNYTLTDEESVSTLVIRENTGDQLLITAWGSDLTLQRVK